MYITARLTPTGLVSSLGSQRLQIGEISDGISARARDLSAVLSHAGIDTQVSARIREQLWTKVALNLATNPLSVITESTLVEQFTDPKLLPIVRAVLEETGRLAAAHHVQPSMSMDVLELAAKIGEDMPTTKLMLALCAHRAQRRAEPAP